MSLLIEVKLRYDSDNPRVYGDVGMAGVAVDSVEDMIVCRSVLILSTIWGQFFILSCLFRFIKISIYK